MTVSSFIQWDFLALEFDIWITKQLSRLSRVKHYNDVIMGTMASQITSLTIVYPTFYSGADQRKHQSSVSLASVWGIHRWPVNSPHKWPVTRKIFPFHKVIMNIETRRQWPKFCIMLLMERNCLWPCSLNSTEVCSPWLLPESQHWFR